MKHYVSQAFTSLFQLQISLLLLDFFLYFTIEQTALTYKHRYDVGLHMHHHSDDEERPLRDSAIDNQHNHHHHHHHYGSTSSHNTTHLSHGSSKRHRVGHDETNNVQIDQNLEESYHSSHGDNPENICSAGQSEVEEGDALHASHGSGTQSSHINPGSCSHEKAEGDDCHDLHSPSKLRSLILLGALSLHSIFEGLALGIPNNQNEVWTLFLAVVIHKSILAFSLGVNFLKTGMGKAAMFRSLILFSLMAPVGITIGIVITQEFSTKFSHSIANGILQGLATGTFLYITFFEVLPHQMNTPRNRLLKVLCIVVGFAIIAVLILLFPS